MRFDSHAVLTRTLVGCVLCFAAGSLVGKSPESHDESTLRWETTYVQRVLPILRSRCAECHTGDDSDGGFNLDQFSDGTHLGSKSDPWAQVGKRLRLNEMPPEGSPGLDDNQKSILHQWIDAKPQKDMCSQLATDETKSWYRGYVMSRRLTRTEYINAIRDLVGVPVSDPALIPSDGSGGEGFDTVGDTLFTSTIHIQRYLTIASDLIDEVVRSPNDESQDSPTDSSRAGLVSEARKRLLVAVPGPQLAERDAAALIVSNFARRAWRRPILADEVERLLTLYDLAKQHDATFLAATAESLKAVLISPHFLFVVETEVPEGGVQRLTPHQLATRLALFIWSSIPDDELLSAADAGKIDTNAQVVGQVRRMLADPKSRALGENFGLQWLGLANFRSTVRPDLDVFPEYNSQLAADLTEEAVRLVWGVLRDDESVLHLIDNPSIEINANLASYYGMEAWDEPDRDGSQWRKVGMQNRRRGGAITLGAVLVSSSYPRRTSPVLRGRWILEELLGDRVPPPPPGVPPLNEAEAEHSLSMRERLEIHRQNPECASCHNRMDPLGFGLENFDGLGRWRDQDGSAMIDASGTLPSGETFSGPEELKKILLQRSRDFEINFVRKLIGFALGRELNEFDRCMIQDCIKQLDSNEHRAATIIETIATSYPFQHRYFKAPQKSEVVGQ